MTKVESARRNVAIVESDRVESAQSRKCPVESGSRKWRFLAIGYNTRQRTNNSFRGVKANAPPKGNSEATMGAYGHYYGGYGTFYGYGNRGVHASYYG